jgi:hypothetical protein
MTTLETASRTLPESIAYLELDFLGRKLLDDDEFEADRRHGERLWDEERVERALHEYRQFLALMLWHPEAFLVPSEDIDEVWHAHVLNTARYQADCETIFGRFQHHFPTFGQSDEVQDEQRKGRDETLQLFADAFGEVPESYECDDYLKCGRGDAAGKCGRKAGKCGRTVAAGKCGRTAGKCGRSPGKCGRAVATGKCGRTEAAGKCGRMVAAGKCGRTESAGKCGRARG